MGRLKAYEERIGEDEDEQQEEDQGKLMYANMETQQEGYGGSRGRGRRGRSNWRGRGRGRSGVYRYGSSRQERRDASHITCYCCDKLGHFFADCPDILLKLQETVEKKEDYTQEADNLMMHEVVYLNEEKVKLSTFEADSDTKNVWYLDNGASNHMSGN